MKYNEFNHKIWLKDFHAASRAGHGFKELRAAIFQDTVSIVNSGGYCLQGQDVFINSDAAAPNAEYFTKPEKLAANKNPHETKYSVIEADCLETAELLLKAGFNPCVLNMASGKNPGGGVLNGSGAQEENLFRRTNLFKSLYQFVDYAAEYGVVRSVQTYPLDRNSGGIYSGSITVFRASENNGYALLKKPYQVSFVSVPAINRPELETINGIYYLAKPLVESAKEKIRTILRIAGKYNHDSLILSAFGCGAFANPPNHVALLFKEVFLEDEFINRFKIIVFAIIDDHNSHHAQNPDGNVLPFAEVFAHV
ncbi:TIGR02452 family protein [Spirochaetia bacterium]|nr:TIGR02452 family protein [Spirochaetia bacterium]